MTLSMSDMQDASRVAESRTDNSYDFVRFCAATSVFFSHHFDLAGLPEPRVPGYGQDFGEAGVEIFFCLSGALLFLSLRRSPDWIRFALARILRILPNLAFVLVATSAATFFWYGNYANVSAHLAYVAGNLLMMVKSITQTIPGIFENTVRQAVNEPLWTLPYEMWLYVVLGLLFFLGGRWRTACIFAATAGFGLAWSSAGITGEFRIGALESAEIFRLGSYFLSGTMLAIFWKYVKNHALAIGLAGLIGTVACRNLIAVDTILLSISFAAAVLGLGCSKVMAWFSKGGDPSYGMYLFAWPVQQFALMLIGSFWLSMLAAFVVTVAIGYGTWHTFEQRAMMLARLARSTRPKDRPA